MDDWPVVLKNGIQRCIQAFKQALKMFLGALPSLFLWALIPGGIILASGYWQAYQEVQASLARSYVESVHEVDSTELGSLTLHIQHPQEVRIHATTAQKQPIVARLSSISITDTPPPTFTLTLESPEYVIFGNEEGLPDRSIMTLIPDGEPGKLYFQSINPPSVQNQGTITMHLSLSAPNISVNLLPNSLTVNFETFNNARARQTAEIISGSFAAVIAALAVALVGFGFQQWNKLTEEEQKRELAARKRQEDKRETTSQIEREVFALLQQNNYEDSIELYREWTNKLESEWKEYDLGAYFRDRWRETTPLELQNIVAALNAASDPERLKQLADEIGRAATGDAIRWAYRHLNEHGRQEIRDCSALVAYYPDDMGSVITDLQNEVWHTLLKAWLTLDVNRAVETPLNPLVKKGLEYRGIKPPVNPFTPFTAERDVRFLQEKLEGGDLVDPEWLSPLRAAESAVVAGPAGSGKTAAALLLARENVKSLAQPDRAGESPAGLFPVYCSLKPAANSSQLLDLVNVVGKTLLYYLPLRPAQFLQQEIKERTAMSYCLVHFAGGLDRLSSLFYQSGLLPVGVRLSLLAEIKRLMQDVSFDRPPDEDEALQILGLARPRSERHTLLLLDVHPERHWRGNSAYLQNLCELMVRMAGYGIIVKLFLPAFAGKLWEQLPEAVPLTRIAWSRDNLASILDIRLKRCSEERLANWFEPGERTPSPDKQLIDRGNPGEILRGGQFLLEKIGQEQRLLTQDDLQDLPENED